MNGDRFDLASIDLATTTGDPDVATFVGFVDGVGTVQQAHAVPGRFPAQLATFEFSRFANLTQVEWCGPPNPTIPGSPIDSPPGPVQQQARMRSFRVLDSVLLRRLLAGLPPIAYPAGVTHLKLRRAATNELIESVESGDVWNLSSLGGCLAIDVGINQFAGSARFDWTSPAGAETVNYYWDNSEPVCWLGDSGWVFEDEVPDCSCSPEMAQLGTHVLRIVPCTVDVDFSLGETCGGNGGVEGPPVTVSFTIDP